MKKILIVDDNPDILQVMHLLLGGRGFSVEVTTDGNQTLSKIKSFEPDVIFLDVFLSGMDGRDICKQLKDSPDTKHIPIILFSANKIKSSSVTEAKADAFVSKPFDIQDLLLTIESVLPEVSDSSSMIA